MLADILKIVLAATVVLASLHVINQQLSSRSDCLPATATRLSERSALPPPPRPPPNDLPAPRPPPNDLFPQGPPPNDLPRLQTRDQIPGLIQQQRGFGVGAEIGVQTGQFSHQILSAWKNCREFHLIDLWAVATNYADSAQLNAEGQQQMFEKAQKRLAPWQNITRFHRGRSDQVVNEFSDASLDFVYLDARHDYCAVKTDLQLWWPKLRPGGILAGHDYVSGAAGQDWTLCEDGRHEPGAVKRAVDEHAVKHELKISITSREKHPSYLMRKPY